MAVGPGVHAGEQIVRVLRQAAQHPVDHGHRLGAGDVLVGPEGVVAVSLDPAQRRGAADLVLRPVVGGVRKGGDAGDAAVVEPGADGREFGAG